MRGVMSDETILTVAAYSRHRGVSATAVNKAIKAGRLKDSVGYKPNGKPFIKSAAHADMEWERKTRAHMAGRHGVPRNAPPLTPPRTPGNTGAEPNTPRPEPEAPESPEDDGWDDLPEGFIPDAEISRKRLEYYKAKKAQIEVEKAEGSLVEIEAVEEVVGDQLAIVRARIINIPANLAHELLEMTDPAEVQERIEAEITAALEELTADDGDTTRFTRSSS